MDTFTIIIIEPAFNLKAIVGVAHLKDEVIDIALCPSFAQSMLSSLSLTLFD